jgi:hypothetical protein
MLFKFFINTAANASLQVQKRDSLAEDFRDEVKRMFYHAYDNYMLHAFPKDELEPLTCKGKDTWGR